MKTLRTFIIMVVVIIGGMAMTGCEDSNATNNPQTVTTNGQPESQTGEKSLDSSEKKQVLDSINVLVSQIEVLSKSQEMNTNKLNEVTKEMSDLKGSSHLYDLISWVITAIALLVAMISLMKLNSVQKRANRHRKDIGELEHRINTLEQKTNTVPVRNKTANSGLSNSEYTTLSSRIYKIERQLEKMNQSPIQEPLHVVPSNPVSYEKHIVNYYCPLNHKRVSPTS